MKRRAARSGPRAPGTASVRTAILSDQTLFRQGLSVLLKQRGVRDVREYPSSHALLADARQAPPAVLFVDLDHEDEDTMTLVRSLRHELPHTQLVVIGSALRQGAADASFDDELETPRADAVALAAALRMPTKRRPSSEARRQHELWAKVTPRQRDVLRWLATGVDNRTIAAKLRVGERAIKAHISALLLLFGAASRTQLSLLADRAGLRPPRAAKR